MNGEFHQGTYISFYVFVANKNDIAEILIEVVCRCVMQMKLEHF
ncbi:DUF6500 family protein [Enterobacter ludwigii]